MFDWSGLMFLWNMSLETGIDEVDRVRRRVMEAMADFFQVMDDPALDKTILAARTGAIYNAMKTAFAVENQVLDAQNAPDRERHQANHAALAAAFVDLCRKLVPKIKSPRQAHQCCLEIYQLVDESLFHHLTKEVTAYRVLTREPVRNAS